MGTEITIGGERLGSGNKMKAYMHNYERSTHDLSYIWRSTMASGTLVPFMTEIALPGDTFDINLNCEVLTHPTIGPLFGSYKVQLDVFQVPMRLYQAQLHMNALNIGRDMSAVKLPQISMFANRPRADQPIDNQQINPSSIFAYLGIRGLGSETTEGSSAVERTFNAIPYLGYWDIYKNYYANKQEEIGMVIHKVLQIVAPELSDATFFRADEGEISANITPPPVYAGNFFTPVPDTYLVVITSTIMDVSFNPATNLTIEYKEQISGQIKTVTAGEMFESVVKNTEVDQILCTGLRPEFWLLAMEVGLVTTNDIPDPNPDGPPEITIFSLENIDTMRRNILQAAWTSAYVIAPGSASPYGLALQSATDVELGTIYAKTYNQEGLGLKTYNSDLFNNWISTEWIDGADGVSAVTAIDTSGGSFTIDELNLSQKIYNMLNRIALSGGTYDDWLDAVYTHKRQRSAENPMYLGGLIKELIFQEVISTAAAENDPLGTLAGRGTLSRNKHKGGHVIAKIDEPSYIMGIVSITPRIDYSQGNKWDTNLLTMNDLHKPALDAIGFQDLTTDQMAWFDTQTDGTTFPATISYKSAGKQPAWINYMTNVNKVLGNFAVQSQQMYMVLNRRYEVEFDIAGNTKIADLTTYIDPSKFNHIFADTRIDAQNFWTQIGVNIQARRKMSAKIIPNL